MAIYTCAWIIYLYIMYYHLCIQVGRILRTARFCENSLCIPHPQQGKGSLKCYYIMLQIPKIAQFLKMRITYLYMQFKPTLSFSIYTYELIDWFQSLKLPYRVKTLYFFICFIRLLIIQEYIYYIKSVMKMYSCMI